MIEPFPHPVSGPAATDAVVQLARLGKGYVEGDARRQVLAGVDLSLQAGEFAVLLGRSGSGKSTLLNLISGIDLPDAGAIRVGGVELTRLSERERTLFRRRHIGFIYQFFNLIPILSVWENLVLPLELEGPLSAEQAQRARHLLQRMGLTDRAQSFPDRLSGGEQQRVAIARALVNDPAIVLADEPTGNLDAETGQQVLELLLEAARAEGHTLLMVTHSSEVARLADRVFELREQTLVEHPAL